MDNINTDYGISGGYARAGHNDYRVIAGDRSAYPIADKGLCRSLNRMTEEPNSLFTRRAQNRPVTSHAVSMDNDAAKSILKWIKNVDNFGFTQSCGMNNQLFEQFEQQSGKASAQKRKATTPYARYDNHARYDHYARYGSRARYDHYAHDGNHARYDSNAR